MNSSVNSKKKCLPLPPEILDRKNGEIEETKSLHRAKQKESEETIRKLERKGERSRDCGVNWKDVYSSVSEHSVQIAPKRYNCTRGLAGVARRSPAVLPNLTFLKFVLSLPYLSFAIVGHMHDHCTNID